MQQQITAVDKCADCQAERGREGREGQCGGWLLGNLNFCLTTLLSRPHGTLSCLLFSYIVEVIFH